MSSSVSVPKGFLFSLAVIKFQAFQQFFSLIARLLIHQTVYLSANRHFKWAAQVNIAQKRILFVHFDWMVELKYV